MGCRLQAAGPSGNQAQAATAGVGRTLNRVPRARQACRLQPAACGLAALNRDAHGLPSRVRGEHFAIASHLRTTNPQLYTRLKSQIRGGGKDKGGGGRASR